MNGGLSDEAIAETLVIAAELGDSLALPILIDAGAAPEVIDALMDQGQLVTEADGIHARLIARKNTTIPRLPAGAKRACHSRLARALARHRAAPEVIARQFTAARDYAAARAEWVRAGEQACDNGEHRQAAVHLRAALAHWPIDTDGEERIRVLRALARCSTNSRRLADVLFAWEEIARTAAECGDASTEVEALGELAGCAGDATKAEIHLRRAAEIAANSLPPAAAAHTWLAHADFLAARLRLADAQSSASRARGHAEASDDIAVRVEVAGFDGLLSAMRGDHSSARSHLANCLRLAVASGQPALTAYAYKRQANVCDYLGDYPGETHAHREAIRLCRETSNAETEKSCLACLSYACFRTGDWKEAVRTARTVTAGRDAGPELASIGDIVTGLVAVFRGEFRTGRRRLEHASAFVRERGILGLEFFARWGLGFASECSGDASAAEAAYDALRGLWRETEDAHDALPGLLFAGAFYADTGRTAALGDCADIVARIGARQDHHESSAAQKALTGEIAIREGSVAEGLTLLTNARDLYCRSGLPLEALWTGRRRVKAGAPPDQSVTTGLRRLGASAVLAYSINSDVGTSTVPPDGPNLTPRMRDVLGHLAAGLTSKEIADRLTLSVRTVEMHTARLMDRLDCRTRPEAIRRAMDRGWLP